jgi:hypothetical protein
MASPTPADSPRPSQLCSRCCANRPSSADSSLRHRRPLWFRILATQKLSTCYPLFVSLTYALITIGALYFLHEKISAQKLLGLLIIIVGITTVARG